MENLSETSDPVLKDLVERAQSGDRASLARLLSHIERGRDLGAVMRKSAAVGNALEYTIGITGSPGAGKSTLLGALLAHSVQIDARSAALVVDPSSPISGGALLGDRLRMQSVSTDPRVFVRSMASRGRTGGLSDTTRAAVRCLHACGWPRVFIETVGIGQVDIDVSTIADTVIVVLNPGAGDEVQVSKAGLMEIADVFVINKADHPGVKQLRLDLRGLITTLPAGRTRPVVVETVAITGEGIAGLWSAIFESHQQAEKSGELQRRRELREARMLHELAQTMLRRRLDTAVRTAAFREIQDAIAAGEISLYEAASRLVDVVGAQNADGLPLQ